MFKKIKLFMTIVAFITFVFSAGLILTGCGEKGGTIIARNEFGSDTNKATFMVQPKGGSITTKYVEPGESASFNIDENIDVSYSWVQNKESGSGTISVKNGETYTVTLK